MTPALRALLLTLLWVGCERAPAKIEDAPLWQPTPASADRNLLRCVGEGAHQRCARRARLADAFDCTDKSSCTQRHPRLPDDGEWTCIDLSGAVLCRDGQAASGVAVTVQEPGWECGQRRGSHERLCLDLDPDRPSGSYSCHFEHIPRDRRICVPQPVATPRLGDTCSADAACPKGARCTSGRCLPPGLTPECWFDADCGAGRCQLGRCG